MTGSAVIFAPIYVTPGAVLLWLATSAVTLCLGHSIGLHRLLIHRSFAAPLWFERVLVYLGTLVGMAGPLGMVRLHDMRDWAQRQVACHDLHAHRASWLRDAWWQMHCRLDLTHPPRFEPEMRLRDDRFFAALESSWMAQQIPWALLFLWAGGLPWLVWGVPVRVAVGVTGHWLVGHITHRRGRKVGASTMSRSRATTCPPPHSSPSARRGMATIMPGPTPRGWGSSRASMIRAGGCCWACAGSGWSAT